MRARKREREGGEEREGGDGGNRGEKGWWEGVGGGGSVRVCGRGEVSTILRRSARGIGHRAEQSRETGAEPAKEGSSAASRRPRGGKAFRHGAATARSRPCHVPVTARSWPGHGPVRRLVINRGV